MPKVLLKDVCKINQHKQVEASLINDLISDKKDIALLPSSQNYGLFTSFELGDKYKCMGEVITLGRARYANIKYHNGYFISSNNIIVESSDPQHVLTKYIYYFLLVHAHEIYIEKTTYPVFDQNLFNTLEIDVPNMDRQQQIVDICDNIYGAINEKVNQNILLDELVKSRFIELFGDGSYPQIPLIQLIVEGAGLSYGIIVPGDNVEDGVPMVRPSDFNNGELCLDNVYRVAPEIEAKYTRTRLIGNEILVQVIGQPGQIMLSDSRCKGMNVTRNLAVVRPDCNRINRIYLKTYMQSQEAQAFMLGETKQSTLKQLPLSRLKELDIPVPPMELQEQFAAFVKQTDKSKLAATETLKYLEELKSSLMDKYFN